MTNTKRCYKCGDEKLLTEFQKNRTKKYGVQGQCKECESKYTRKWYTKNRKSHLANCRKWREENPEQYRESGRESSRKWAAANPGQSSKWAIANPEKARESSRKYRAANTDKTNARNARRRALKLQATPPWARTGHEKLTVDQFFADAALLNEIWNWDLEVDHIIPLTPMNEFAPQGLHVSANLQLLDASVNASKSNNWQWVPPVPVFGRT